ncbi:MAG: hypothetical protein AAGF15_00200 [Pseudomonadota bacterium]
MTRFSSMRSSHWIGLFLMWALLVLGTPGTANAELFQRYKAEDQKEFAQSAAYADFVNAHNQDLVNTAFASIPSEDRAQYGCGSSIRASSKHENVSIAADVQTIQGALNWGAWSAVVPISGCRNASSMVVLFFFTSNGPGATFVGFGKSHADGVNLTEINQVFGLQVIRALDEAKIDRSECQSALRVLGIQVVEATETRYGVKATEEWLIAACARQWTAIVEIEGEPDGKQGLGVRPMKLVEG